MTIQIPHVAHGGCLTAVAKKYQRPLDEWLDLSTGISPWPYPVAEIPTHIWQRLPDGHEPLLQTAEQYYQVPSSQLTVTPGSQYVIMQLPRLTSPATVAIPMVGYQEHARAWAAAGHVVIQYRSWQELLALAHTKQTKHVVIIHPNNPTGDYCPPEVLQAIVDILPGYCVIDEAFIDISPELSFANPLLSSKKIVSKNMIILRSVGKFFGLAGLRLGFMLGSGQIVDALRQDLHPWGVSHPALHIGNDALANITWQQQQRDRIQRQSESMLQQLNAFLGKHPATHAMHHCSIADGGLFITITGDNQWLLSLYYKAAEQGILFRHDALSPTLGWLRIGLPGHHEKRLYLFLQDNLS